MPSDLAKVAACLPFHSKVSTTEGVHKVQEPAPARCKKIKLKVLPSLIFEVERPIGVANTQQTSFIISCANIVELNCIFPKRPFSAR